MIETPMLTVEESARRDAFVRRRFLAIVEGGNLVTIYLGNLCWLLRTSVPKIGNFPEWDPSLVAFSLLKRGKCKAIERSIPA